MKTANTAAGHGQRRPATPTPQALYTLLCRAVPPKKSLNMSAFRVALMSTSFRPGLLARSPFRMMSRKSVSKSRSCTCGMCASHARACRKTWSRDVLRFKHTYPHYRMCCLRVFKGEHVRERCCHSCIWLLTSHKDAPRLRHLQQVPPPPATRSISKMLRGCGTCRKYHRHLPQDPSRIPNTHTFLSPSNYQ